MGAYVPKNTIRTTFYIALHFDAWSFPTTLGLFFHAATFMVVCIQFSTFFPFQNDSGILKDLEDSQHEAADTKIQDAAGGKFTRVCIIKWI